MASARIPDLTLDGSPLDTDELAVHKIADARAKKTTRATLRAGLAADPHGAAAHTGSVFPSSATNQTLGAADISISQKAAPSNPASGTRKLYVDSSTGKLSVRTSSGTSISLEEQSGISVASRVRLRLSANVTLVAGTDTLLSWATEDADTDGFHDTVTNPQRILLPSVGLYLVTFSCEFAISSSGDRMMWIRQDGTTVIAGNTPKQVASVTTKTNVTVPVYSTSSTYVECFVRSSVGIDVLASEATHFAASRIG